MEFQPALLHHLQLEAQQKILLNGWALLPSLMLIYDAQGEEKRQSFNLADQTLVDR
ncbi:hypothetical protein [Candidatus Reidiella endopervernicosa]|uniref:Uncharacterized protein n=1 Tax=Candidatus Reidiella endopervernicosa TaxID=2738883 RepID=A0A6N0HYN5_9GAMM|nr:hypothetical protein [Candidatus Reidiella endopervernicosa]QKQ27371.1 hypothetical protein HUE57_14600 [Candidatus Reidiella endopervernicosa]